MYLIIIYTGYKKVFLHTALVLNEVSFLSGATFQFQSIKFL